MTDKTPNEYEIQSSRATPPLEFEKIHSDLEQARGTNSQNTTMAVALIFIGIMSAGLMSMMFDVRVSLLVGAVFIIFAVVLLVQGGRDTNYFLYATWILETQKPQSEEIKVTPDTSSSPVEPIQYKATVKSSSGEQIYNVEVLTSLPSHTETFINKFVPARIYHDPSNGLAVVAELEGDAESTRVWFSKRLPAHS